MIYKRSEAFAKPFIGTERAKSQRFASAPARRPEDQSQDLATPSYDRSPPYIRSAALILAASAPGSKCLLHDCNTNFKRIYVALSITSAGRQKMEKDPH